MAENKIKILKFGSDPEFLLRDKNTKELISSIGIIPGTKEEPVKVPEMGEYFTVQIDNVLGEISVNPADNPEELWNNIQAGFDYIRNNHLPENVEIFHASSGSYSDEQLDNDIARVFGCSPSFNAWTEEQNAAPEVDGNVNFRGCGAHIHLSYENPTVETNCLIGRVFDLFCTVPSILLDDDTERRKFYGKAGEIRNCSYGVELRTLGGFLLSDKAMYDFMMNNLLEAIKFINDGKVIDDKLAVGIQMAIDTQSKEVAQKVIEFAGIPMLTMLTN